MPHAPCWELFTLVLLIIWKELGYKCGAYKRVTTVVVVRACEIDDCKNGQKHQ